MRSKWIIAVLMLLHFLLVLRLGVFFLGGIPHIPDSAVYYRQAVLLGTGHVSIPTEGKEPIEVYKLMGLQERKGRLYFYYSNFWPALLALPVKFGFASAVNPLLSAASLLLIFLIASKMFNEQIGLIASVIYAVSPFTIIMAADFMSHTATQFFLLASFYCLMLYTSKGKAWAALLAGLCLGYGFAIRPLTAIGVSVPMLAYFIFTYWRKVRRVQSIFFCAGFAFILGLLFLENYVVTGSALHFVHPIQNGPPLSSIIGVNAFKNGINLQEALLGFLPSIVFYSPVPMLIFGLAWLPLIFCRARKDYALAAIFLSLLVAYMFTVAIGIHGYGPRYIFEALFALFILAGRGASWLVEKSAGALKYVMVVCMGVLLLYNIFGFFLIAPSYFNYNWINNNIAAELQQLDLENAIILVPFSWNWFSDGVTTKVFDPFFENPMIIKEQYNNDKHFRVLERYPDRKVYTFNGHVIPYTAKAAPNNST